MRTAALALLLAAVSARATTYSLTVATAGPVTPLVVVTSTPSGIVCPGTCSADFLAGSTVTLGEVRPSTVAFVGWTNAPRCRTNNPDCSVTITAASTVTAHFAPTLRLQFSGNGIGQVTDSTSVVQSLDGSTRLVYPEGTAIVLRASTGAASAFLGWSGDGGCSTASTCTITLNGSEVVTATFTADGVGPYDLGVTVPNYGGTVMSNPPGISCGRGVCVATFTAGTDVSLNTATFSGYYFAGWANGGCSGKNPCVVKSTSPLQGIGRKDTPAAYFYRTNP